MSNFKSDNFYQVLARKYRPRSFTDLKGQPQLIKIMRNAIFSGRIPQAILLMGDRGIGKTTSARIIAQALNCQQLDRTSPDTINPCGQCSACESIQAGTQLDLVEMDAASHSGVDNIRPIIRSNLYKPIKLTYKIFIIDEVHMLTKYAFNALLKTLEEPAPHLKFIFATTEVNRIPDTIISRCLRFHLSSFSIADLTGLINDICTKENITINPAACRLLAYSASGSARDALSLLDQAINCLGTSLHLNDLRTMLGYANQNEMIEFVIALSQHNMVFIIERYNKCIEKGINPLNILKEIHHIIYILILIKAKHLTIESALIELDQLEVLNQLCQSITQPTLMRIWQSLSKGINDLKYCYSVFEAGLMTLLRLCYLSELPEVSQLIEWGNQKEPGDNVIQPFLPSIQTNLKNAPVEDEHDIVRTNSQKKFEYLNITSVEELLNLCNQHRESLLSCHIEKDMVIHQIDNFNRCITLSLLDKAPKKLVLTLKEFLSTTTKNPWKIVVEDLNSNKPSLYQERKIQQQLLHEKILTHPDIVNIISKFPGAQITTILKN